MHSQDETISPLVHALCGSVAGTASALLMQPIEVIKTKVIIDRVSYSTALRSIFSEGGISPFFKGAPAIFLGVSPGIALYFGMLQVSRRLFRRLFMAPPIGTGSLSGAVASSVGQMREFRTWELTAIAFVARAGVTVLLNPALTVRSRMEYQKNKSYYSSVWDALWRLARDEGFRGMMSGVGSSILANAPFSAIYLPLFTQVHKTLSRLACVHTGKTHGGLTLVSGFVAGSLTTFVTHPMEVITTRAQVRGMIQKDEAMGSMESDNAEKDNGSSDVIEKSRFRRMWRDTRNLWRGITVQCLKRGITSSITWYTFDRLLKTAKLIEKKLL
uniref:Mitochondrial carrier family protein 2 n=1 Tax=Stygiella incarcerata TaxID=1712417 RepID=A0A192ZIU7_9EUKA|nr:mitochondrial carrier family protein 2 [Stygiella incarcerata]|eukprot:TRINITY_DN24805_c0_g1_i2.p1 TRINITY_DN24805_c0_g1~~TRINITY_DN24805_c0_g1_i2.p1  ORF type:complete len:329 (+),score=65.86 TRINITY_DN24805_c0_g1_i2:93-1079(+)